MRAQAEGPDLWQRLVANVQQLLRVPPPPVRVDAAPSGGGEARARATLLSQRWAATDLHARAGLLWEFAATRGLAGDFAALRDRGSSRWDKTARERLTAAVEEVEARLVAQGLWLDVLKFVEPRLLPATDRAVPLSVLLGQAPASKAVEWFAVAEPAAGGGLPRLVRVLHSLVRQRPPPLEPLASVSASPPRPREPGTPFEQTCSDGSTWSLVTSSNQRPPRVVALSFGGRRYVPAEPTVDVPGPIRLVDEATGEPATFVVQAQGEQRRTLRVELRDGPLLRSLLGGTTPGALLLADSAGATAVYLPPARAGAAARLVPVEGLPVTERLASGGVVLSPRGQPDLKVVVDGQAQVQRAELVGTRRDWFAALSRERNLDPATTAVLMQHTRSALLAYERGGLPEAWLRQQLDAGLAQAELELLEIARVEDSLKYGFTGQTPLFVATFDDGSAAVAKADSFQPEGVPEREMLAFELETLLGVAGVPHVPVATRREIAVPWGDRGESRPSMAVVQAKVAGTDFGSAPLGQRILPERARVWGALIDHLLVNQDRNTGNLLIEPLPEGGARYHLIDQGDSLDSLHGDLPSRAGQPIEVRLPDDLRAHLAALLANPAWVQGVVEAFERAFSATEAEAQSQGYLQRLGEAVRTGSFPSFNKMWAPWDDGRGGPVAEVLKVDEYDFSALMRSVDGELLVRVDSSQGVHTARTGLQLSAEQTPDGLWSLSDGAGNRYAFDSDRRALYLERDGERLPAVVERGLERVFIRGEELLALRGTQLEPLEPGALAGWVARAPEPGRSNIAVLALPTGPTSQGATLWVLPEDTRKRYDDNMFAFLPARVLPPGAFGLAVLRDESANIPEALWREVVAVALAQPRAEPLVIAAPPGGRLEAALTAANVPLLAGGQEFLDHRYYVIEPSGR